MPLIPEAAAIKETLKHADALSGAVAEEMKLMQQPTAEELTPLMCAYIGFKYLLPGAVGADELLEDVGKRSLEYVRKNGNSVAGMDVLPHCGSASVPPIRRFCCSCRSRKISVSAFPQSGGRSARPLVNWLR